MNYDILYIVNYFNKEEDCCNLKIET